MSFRKLYEETFAPYKVAEVFGGMGEVTSEIRKCAQFYGYELEEDIEEPVVREIKAMGDDAVLFQFDIISAQEAGEPDEGVLNVEVTKIIDGYRLESWLGGDDE